MLAGNSAANVVAIVAGSLGIVVGVAGVVSVLIVMGKQKALESSLALFSLANGELRTQVDTARTERHIQEVEFQKQLADERAECARSLGGLQGQVDVLTSGLGTTIAQSVVGAVGQLIEQARADLADKVAEVKADTNTTNGMTMGALADQAEGRRVRDDVAEGDRTTAGQSYVDRITSDTKPK